MRREKEVVITTPGRDQGKRFFIVEMSAAQAERWAMRAFLALSRADTLEKLPEELRGAGMAGIAAIGLRAFAGVTWFDAEPLADEMFACVNIMPDERNSEVKRAVIDDDIEEVWTRVLLRQEVVDLHLGFSLAGWLSSFQPQEASPGTQPQTL